MTTKQSTAMPAHTRRKDVRTRATRVPLRAASDTSDVGKCIEDGKPVENHQIGLRILRGRAILIARDALALERKTHHSQLQLEDVPVCGRSWVVENILATQSAQQQHTRLRVGIVEARHCQWSERVPSPQPVNVPVRSERPGRKLKTFASHEHLYGHA